MGALVTNNATGTLASSINDSVLSLTLNSGQGALFPNPTGGDYFYVTIQDNSNNKEIVKCTARSTNTLTIVRAQDGTSARAFTAGDRVELRPVAALHANYAQKDSANSFTGDQTVAGKVTVTGSVGSERIIEFRSGAADVRWRIVVEDTAEGGSDAGSNFELQSFGDDEAFQALALSINRATGIITVLEGFKVGANKGDAFPAGTKLLFRQADTPSGWTKDTTYNNAVLRVVSGAPSQKADSGKGLTELLTARTIARANLPNVTLAVTGSTNTTGAHTHTIDLETNNDSSIETGSGRTEPLSPSTVETNSAGNHSHTVSGTTESINGNTTQTTMDFAVNYVDMYIATKDA